MRILMLHVKCNCRFERRGGDDSLMDSLIHGRLYLEQKANKSHRFGIVTRGVISGGRRGHPTSKHCSFLELSTHGKHSRTPTHVSAEVLKQGVRVTVCQMQLSPEARLCMFFTPSGQTFWKEPGHTAPLGSQKHARPIFLHFLPQWNQLDSKMSRTMREAWLVSSRYMYSLEGK